MEPKVSIVIPCFNDADYIEQSVNSALGQTYANKEIIVVDDGSNTRTKAVLAKLSSKINKLITQENTGVIGARNNAIELAEGEYILTLDSDDTFEPSFLQKSVEILKQSPEIGMVTCWVAIRNEGGNFLRLMKPSGASAFAAMFRNNAPGNLLFRKICWENVGGYDPKLANGYEDWEFNIAVCKKGWRIKVIPEVLFNYTEKNYSRNKSAKNFYNEIRRYTFKKHQDLLVENIDRTIDLLLKENELSRKEVRRVKSSYPHKVGDFFLRPLRLIKKIFS